MKKKIYEKVSVPEEIIDDELINNSCNIGFERDDGMEHFEDPPESESLIESDVKNCHQRGKK